MSHIGIDVKTPGCLRAVPGSNLRYRNKLSLGSSWVSSALSGICLETITTTTNHILSHHPITKSPLTLGKLCLR